ncbi:hypothetical protein LDENG_00230490 [Lucifuga dentata]|nr:hypothetical protein LDENG_00230490 [Lucifuga dentata]
MMDYLFQECLKYQQVEFRKTFLIHCSSFILREMIVSNVTCMKIKYIRLKHAKWLVWSFNKNIAFN